MGEKLFQQYWIHVQSWSLGKAVKWSERAAALDEKFSSDSFFYIFHFFVAFLGYFNNKKTFFSLCCSALVNVLNSYERLECCLCGHGDAKKERMLGNYIKSNALGLSSMCFSAFRFENDLSCALTLATQRERNLAQFFVFFQPHQRTTTKSFHTFFIFISPFNKFPLLGPFFRLLLLV